LEVSRSGYYAWVECPVSERERKFELLKVSAAAAYRRSGGVYGSPRVHKELVADGIVVSEKTVAKAMKEAQIVGKPKQRYVATTDSKNSQLIADNLLKRNFAASRPNEVWVTDVTAIWTWEGWVYLAAIIDLFGRRVVGWAVSDVNDTALALDALRRAQASRKPPHGLIHHSDRGSPYASHEYVAALHAFGMQPSMSRKGDCWDNAIAESFWASLKNERLDARSYTSRACVHREISDYIDHFYNQTRRHSSLNYFSPIQFELRAAAGQLAA
jgi:putative transposase